MKFSSFSASLLSSGTDKFSNSKNTFSKKISLGSCRYYFVIENALKRTERVHACGNWKVPNFVPFPWKLSSWLISDSKNGYRQIEDILRISLLIPNDLHCWSEVMPSLSTIRNEGEAYLQAAILKLNPFILTCRRVNGNQEGQSLGFDRGFFPSSWTNIMVVRKAISWMVRSSWNVSSSILSLDSSYRSHSHLRKTSSASAIKASSVTWFDWFEIFLIASHQNYYLFQSSFPHFVVKLWRSCSRRW